MTSQRYRLVASTIPLLLSLSSSCSSSTSGSDDRSVQWIDPKSIKPQPSRSSHLSAEQIRRAERLQAALAEVDHSSVAKWVEGFEKDRDPERELQVCEAISEAYQAYASSQSLSLAQKREVLKLLLVRSGTANEQEVLKRTPVVTLTPDQAAAVVRMFKGMAAPIEVETK